MQDWKSFWRQVLSDKATAWVVFEHGTCLLGNEVFAYHRLQYDSFGHEGDVIRHSGGCLYTTGGISNWVERREGESRDQIIERALEQRRADQLSKRVVWVESGPSAVPAGRVADLILKAARKEQARSLKLEAERVSFLRGEGWVTLMQPPAAHMTELLEYFSQTGLEMVRHEGWAEVRLVS